MPSISNRHGTSAPGVRIDVARPQSLDAVNQHRFWGSPVGRALPQPSPACKSRMLRRLVGPWAMSAIALAQEVGVGQPLLSRWLRESRTVEDMNSPQTRKWTGAEKLRAPTSPRGGATKARMALYMYARGVGGLRPGDAFDSEIVDTVVARGAVGAPSGEPDAEFEVNRVLDGGDRHEVDRLEHPQRPPARRKMTHSSFQR